MKKKIVVIVIAAVLALAVLITGAVLLLKNSFGQFITKINHENSKSIELKPISFQHYNQTIPEFIESLMNLIDLKKIMITYKDLYNVIKAFGYNDLLGRIKIDRVSKMVHEVERAAHGEANVHLIGKIGGILHKPDEIYDKIKEING